MSVPGDGSGSIWYELTEGHAVAADVKALELERGYEADDDNVWTPRNAAEQRCTYSARCEAAMIRHLGGTKPASVGVRSTPLSAGRCWPRFADVKLAAVVFARGPYLHHPARRQAQERRDPDRSDLRWVELVGWIEGSAIERVGIVKGQGYVIPWSGVEPIRTLARFIAGADDGETALFDAGEGRPARPHDQEIT